MERGLFMIYPGKRHFKKNRQLTAEMRQAACWLALLGPMAVNGVGPYC